MNKRRYLELKVFKKFILFSKKMTLEELLEQYKMASDQQGQIRCPFLAATIVFKKGWILKKKKGFKINLT